MEATRTVVETEPQLTLRLYRGMNPALKQKALDVLAEGRTYPMLYNDDVNVPAVQKVFHTAHVPLGDLWILLPFPVALFLSHEGYKWLRRRNSQNTLQPDHG